MNNFNDIFQKLKRVFTSDKNSNYLLQLIAESTNISLDVQEYKSTLTQLQSMIYDMYVQQICSDLSNRGKLNLEEVLIILNKITINRFQDVIRQDAMSNINQTVEPNGLYISDDAKTNTQPSNNANDTPNTYANPDSLGDTTKTNTKVIPFTQTTVYHFFSEDSVLKSGRYTFPFVLNSIKSIEVSGLKVNCNIYNVTDANNKFSVTEGSQKINISIPIGYYTTDNLCKAISELLNHHSVNKYKYQLFRNPVKNRIYFQCNLLSVKDSKPATFSLHFPDAVTRNEPGLNDLLGFQKSEYINNNMYVSETHPIDNILQDMYLKVFINDKQIPRITTTKNGFSYFENYSIDLNQHFGKSVTLLANSTSHQVFEISEELDCNELSIELWNNTKSPITRSTEFECTFTFEHTPNY